MYNAEKKYDIVCVYIYIYMNLHIIKKCTRNWTANDTQKHPDILGFQ